MRLVGEGSGVVVEYDVLAGEEMSSCIGLLICLLVCLCDWAPSWSGQMLHCVAAVVARVL